MGPLERDKQDRDVQNPSQYGEFLAFQFNALGLDLIKFSQAPQNGIELLSYIAEFIFCRKFYTSQIKGAYIAQGVQSAGQLPVAIDSSDVGEEEIIGRDQESQDDHDDGHDKDTVQINACIKRALRYRLVSYGVVYDEQGDSCYDIGDQ